MPVSREAFLPVIAELRQEIRACARSEDLERFATKEDLERFPTKEDLKRFATKDDLERFATKEDLERFATKDDLKRCATKDDLEQFATKRDLEELRREMRAGFDELRRHMGVLVEDVLAGVRTMIEGVDVRPRVARLEERTDALEQEVHLLRGRVTRIERELTRRPRR